MFFSVNYKSHDCAIFFVLNIIKMLLSSHFVQAHPEELGAIVEILKSGMVTSVSGSQYRLHNDAKIGRAHV